MLIGDGGHARVIRSFWPTSDDATTVIAIGDNRQRKKVAEEQPRYCIFGIICHPTAYLHSLVGDGTVVMAGAVIQTGCRIGKHCIINTGATIDHDCTLEDYVHIAPGAHLCGNVHVGEGTLVGVGVGIAPNTKIPAWSLVKARRLEIVAL